MTRKSRKHQNTTHLKDFNESISSQNKLWYLNRASITQDLTELLITESDLLEKSEVPIQTKMFNPKDFDTLRKFQNLF